MNSIIINPTSIRINGHRIYVNSKEEHTMKPGDTVKVKGCTDARRKYNGMTGIYLEPSEYDHKLRRICFDGTGRSCGWVFDDSELEVILSISIGSKVTVTDGSYSYEFADGKFIESYSGVERQVYEITEIGCDLPSRNDEQRNDTIIRRISDGRVFFVQQRFLKAFVALPKFSVGQIVEAQNNYCRVAKVNDDLTYVITGCVNVYNDGSADIVVDESELSEVDTK